MHDRKSRELPGVSAICMYVLMSVFAIVAGDAVGDETPFELWNAQRPFPSVEQIKEVPNATYVMVHEGTEGQFQFLHESGIGWYQGRLYAAWVNGLENEADPDGIIRGRVSDDGGLTWSEPEVIASYLEGPERWEYASFVNNDQQLWMFSTRCHSAWDFADPKLEAFVLNGRDSAWRRVGVVAEEFVATDKPRRLDNGRWIFAGMYQGRNRLAISGVDDLTTWTMTEIPHPEGLRWPLVSLVINGSDIMAIMRNSKLPQVLISFSTDYGQTWTEAKLSNLPMTASKPFAGMLSTGQMFLVSTTPGEGWRQRDWLTIAVSKPGEQVFSAVWYIRGHGAPPLRWPGRAKSPQWSYPKAVEYNGNLYVIYSVGKEDAELAIIPLESLALSDSFKVQSTTLSSKNFLGGHGNNLWDVAENWDPAGVPTASDAVLFQSAGLTGPVIDNTVNAVCRRMDGPAAGSVSPPGEGQTLSITGGSLHIGQSAGDAWRIPSAFGSGSANVQISGGEVSVYDYLFVGWQGPASLTMTGGLLSTGSGGIDVGRDRFGSTFFGRGTINLHGGTIKSGAYLGLGNAGQAFLNMTGGRIDVETYFRTSYTNPEAYSKIVIDDGMINIGAYARFAEHGTSELEMNGGVINFGDSLRLVAARPSSITMNGGQINVANWVRVGEQDTLAWTMHDGRLTTGEFLRIGHNSGIGTFEMHDGRLDIRDLRLSEHLEAGHDGRGTFAVSGGVVNIETNLRTSIGQPAAYGEIVMTGGQMNVGTWARIGETGASKWTMNAGELNIGDFFRLGHEDTGDGQFELNDGIVNVASYLTVGLHGAGAVVMNGGQLNIEHLTVGERGHFELNGGVLTIEGDMTHAVGHLALAGRLVSHGGRGKIHSVFNASTGRTEVTAQAPDRSAAAPLSPIGHEVEAAQPVLAWSAGFDADHYVVYFGKNRDLVQAADASVYLTTVHRDGDQNDVFSYTLPNLQNETVYYWRVDGYGESPVVGAVWTFRTQSPRLAAPLYPGDLNHSEYFDLSGFSTMAQQWHMSSPQIPFADIPQAPLPYTHPFWPSPHLSLITDAGRHRSRGSGLVILDHKWVFFWREAAMHAARDPQSSVMIADSYDRGQTLENIRAIYHADQHGGVEWTDIRARVMGNGRIGVYGTRRNAANPDVYNEKPLFAYSDDEGQTWSFVGLDHFSTASGSPSFTFNEFPASVGGHDTDGYLLYWRGDDGSVYISYTLDNGLTWHQQAANGTGLQGEASVVRLGDSDRWIMVGRAHSFANPIHKSTDLFNWDGPYPSGKHVGSNPGTMVYNKCDITWIAASRPYHFENDDSRAIPVDGEIFQGLVTTTACAETIWNDPSQWPDWSILMYLPVHFDGTFVRDARHWYMIFGAVEGPLPASGGSSAKTYSRLGIMSSVMAGMFYEGTVPGFFVQGNLNQKTKTMN